MYTLNTTKAVDGSGKEKWKTTKAATLSKITVTIINNNILPPSSSSAATRTTSTRSIIIKRALPSSTKTISLITACIQISNKALITSKRETSGTA